MPENISQIKTEENKNLNNIDADKNLIFSTLQINNYKSSPIKTNEVQKSPDNDVNKNENIFTTNEIIKNKIINKLNLRPMISPSRASLNISPKSAFVFNKKMFN